MRKPAAIGRADLLGALVAAGSATSVPVGLLGFELGLGGEVGTAKPRGGLGPEPGLNRPVSPGGPRGAAAVVPFELGQRRVRFLVPVEVEVLADDPGASDEGSEPFTPGELAMPAAVPVAPKPLVPWSRLAPFLRGRLGTLIAGRRLDDRRLSRWVAAGHPWRRLPRACRRVWGPGACVLVDIGPEMEPFLPDIWAAVRRLKRERGRCGLLVLRFRGAQEVPNDPPPGGIGGAISGTRLVGDSAEPYRTRSRPGQAFDRDLPSGVPVVAISAMGQLEGTPETCLGWMRLGQALARAGHRITALSPCPKRLAHPGVAAVWPTAVWDHQPRLPRRLPGSRLAGESVAEGWSVRAPGTAAEGLLDLLATATLITPDLLREVRLLVGGHTDVGSEYEVWFHPDTTGSESIRYFSLRPGPSYEEHLRRFAALAEGVATRDLAFRASTIIAEHHRRRCCPVIAEEASVRSWLAGAPGTGPAEETRALLKRAVHTLRELADSPGSAEGRETGLARWFEEWVEFRLPPSMRADPRVADLVAQGLALARKFRDRLEAAWPAGTKTQAAFAELRAHALRRGRMPLREHRLALKAGELLLLPGATTPGVDVCVLGRIVMGTPLLHLSGLAEASGGSEAPAKVTTIPVELPDAASRPCLVSFERPVPFVLESDRERVRFEVWERPPWAASMQYQPEGVAAQVDLGTESHWFRWRPPEPSVRVGEREGPARPGRFVGAWEPRSRPEWAQRLWVDAFGVAAELTVARVSFVLRWIPPGRFRMGSPEDETGRWDDEGPQHEVRITRGFWLGETPVTQAQWQAVAENSGKQPASWKRLFAGKRVGLNPSPSYFQGPAELPVEQVSFEDCQVFCRLFNAMVPRGPGLRLPTEAEWEFACRAGTSSALYTGGITILGENHASELDAIAWYGGNSGLELEVRNSVTSDSWPNKQHPHRQAGTHRVKLKRPNAWGLYDMLGNVWEWCRDGWHDYGADSVSDPFHPPPDDSAARVVRGGSWGHLARLCRAASRLHGEPGRRLRPLGFRLAAGQEPGAAEPPAAGAERPVGPERRSRG